MWLAAYFGIQVIFSLPPTCGDHTADQILGCCDAWDHVHIRPNMSPMATECVIFHEVAHTQGFDEVGAEELELAYCGGYKITREDYD